MKIRSNQKGSTLLIVAIAVGLTVAGAGGYIAVKAYQKNQEAKNVQILKEKQVLLEQNELARAKSEQEQKLILDQQKQLKETQDSLSALQDKVENIKPTIVYKTEVVQAPESQKKELDTASIVSQWKTNVAEITCEWQYSNGQAYSRARGSGYIVAVNGKAEIIVTNKHVVIDDSLNGTEYPPDWCTIKVYGVGEAKVYGSDVPFSAVSDGSDIAHIDLKKGVTPLSNTLINVPVRNRCIADPEIGDKVVILGYPAIGTTGGITATEGIVSGIEGKYFVTSAKIDHGSSGGVAVLAKGNCFLGIPTWVSSGELESLGRILSYKYIFNQ